MKAHILKRCGSLTPALISLLFILASPVAPKAAAIPSVDDVIESRAEAPTIEDLTDGKVKTGDLIDKNNVDLIKEYISPGINEAIKDGMVIKMGTQQPSDKIVPGYFRDLTNKNRGKAIITDDGTVYYETEGTPWPGGVPFPIPTTGLEALANTKYAWVLDGIIMYPNTLTYTNAEGKVYKSSVLEQRYLFYNTRSKNPPLGTIPGYEDILYKRISVFHSPLELKGLGQYTVRHYDDSKKQDDGFAYFPAYKRTIRISATTWQDNIGGSDMTYGDAGGLSEPYSYWDFKLLGKKYLLLPEPKAPFPYVDEKTGKIDERIKFTVGQKFDIIGWAVWPVCVVEGTPKIKHIYGKKTFFVHAWPYLPATWQIGLVDSYDNQMKLWKVFWNRRNQKVTGEITYTTTEGGPIYDIQTKHKTDFWFIERPYNVKPEDFTLQTLLGLGR
jgi:hypothetical protein